MLSVDVTFWIASNHLEPLRSMYLKKKKKREGTVTQWKTLKAVLSCAEQT